RSDPSTPGLDRQPNRESHLHTGRGGAGVHRRDLVEFPVEMRFAASQPAPHILAQHAEEGASPVSTGNISADYVRCLTRSSSMKTRMPSTAFATPDRNSCGQLHAMRNPTRPRAIMK